MPARSLLAPGTFRELVSGRQRGPLAALARGGLRILEVPYTAAVRWRNRRYDRGRAQIHRVEVPVISVGNLTLGGTGKTPVVEWLARWLGERQVRVGLVSRGYGAQPGQPNDEALELAHKLPGVPHVQDPDRVSGARQVIARFGCSLVLLDDAFQHRRIARDLDIVLVDALEPDGFGHVFPRGTLREPVSSWQRADVVLLARSDLVSQAERQRIREQVLRHAPRAAWVESTYVPRQLESPGGEVWPLQGLHGKRVAAFCGIGNPAGFRHALTSCEFDVAATREFPDHFAYAAEDIEWLARWSDELGVDAVLCTSKDLVKITAPWSGRAPLWALVSQLHITHGQAEFEQALLPLVERSLNSAPSRGGAV